MEAVNVSMHHNAENSQRVWLVLNDFERNKTGDIKYFSSTNGEKSILAQLKITRGEHRGGILTQLIPISGECSGYGRRFIRDMLESSGYAKRGKFQSYSINSYLDLINIHFPAYVGKHSRKIEHIINPYNELGELENNYGI